MVKTTSDPYVGRVSLAGVLRNHQARHDGPCVTISHRFSAAETSNTHPDHDEDEYRSLRKQQRPQPWSPWRHLRHRQAEPGRDRDTLSDKAEPLGAETLTMPEPLLPIALRWRMPRLTKTSCRSDWAG